MGDFGRACASGDSELVKSLLDQAPSSLEWFRLEYLERGLFLAISCKKPNIAKLLLDQGAQISGGTSLAAERARSIEMFELLLNHGWDVNLPSLHDWTVLL